MCITPEPAGNVATAIQLALAPVFLLTGIAGMLNVMMGRLARIVDRGRALADGAVGEKPVELQALERRRRIVAIAITACTLAALSLCMVITALFAGALLDIALDWVVAALFMTATLSLIVGLATFLREVHLSSKSLHFLRPDR